MAAYRLKGIGWILVGTIVAPACYMVSSQVAAERARVEAMERAILQAREDIRALETEFDTRANFAQLERWNGEVLALAAPRPEQYMPGEAALASLRADDPFRQGGEAAVRLASYVVPSAPPPMPVGETPPAGPAPASPPAGAAVRTASVDVATPARSVPAKSGDRAKVQAVAMLDDKLLSDTTMGELLRSARAEGVSLR